MSKLQSEFSKVLELEILKQNIERERKLLAEVAGKLGYTHRYTLQQSRVLDLLVNEGQRKGLVV